MRYYVDYSADFNGTRIMNARYVDLIEGYSTFGDIPKIIETNTGHRNIVVLSAVLQA